MFGLILAVIFWRSRTLFLFPAAQCEDGALMLAYFHNNASPGAVLRIYAGYVSLLPNLIGYLSVHLLPLPRVPHALALFPLLVSAVVYALLLLPRFRFFIASDGWRAGLCLFLLAMPLGLTLLLSNTTYSIWHLLLILVLLVYAPLPTSAFAVLVQCLVMVLAATSHPLSIVVVPLCLFNFITRANRIDRVVNAGLVLVIFAYLYWGTTSIGVDLSNLGAHVYHTSLYLMDRVIFEAVFGYQKRLDLYQAGDMWIMHTAAFVLCAALAALLFWRRRLLGSQDAVHVVVLVYLIVSLTGLSVVSRNMDTINYMGQWNIRYFYVQQILFWLLIAFILYRTVPWQQVRPAGRWLSVAVLLLYLLWINGNNHFLFVSPPASGQELAAFLRQVDRDVEQLRPGETRTFVLRRSCFDIELRYEGDPLSG